MLGTLIWAPLLKGSNQMDSYLGSLADSLDLLGLLFGVYPFQ